MEEDAVFENEPAAYRTGQRAGAVDQQQSDLRNIAIAHERYKQGRSLQGNTVAPKNAPIWMTSLPHAYYSAKGSDNNKINNNNTNKRNLSSTTLLPPTKLPLEANNKSKSPSSSPKSSTTEENEPREPLTLKFVGSWLTKRQLSLFLFREENIMRQIAVSIAEWRMFEYIVIAAILANVIVMTMQTMLPKNDIAPITRVLDKTELPFVIFFTFEAGIKIIAMGFLLNRDAYLRSFWNVLDFVVVVTGLLTILFTSIDLSFLRTLRILRPLKLATRVRPLKVILSAIITAMVPLLQIAAILLFVIAIFAVIGMQFYVGIFHWTCFDRESGKIKDDNPKPCAPDGSHYGSGAHNCDKNTTCRRYWLGPNQGITNFDNIGYAMLTVFQCVTTEGWTDFMYQTDGVYGRSFNWIYFCILIVVGTFFMLNLVLGVLSAEFTKERGRMEKRREYLRRHRQEIFYRELTSYLNWITIAENSVLDDPDVGTMAKLRIIQVRKETEAEMKNKNSGFAKFRQSTMSVSSMPSTAGGDSNNEEVFANQDEAIEQEMKDEMAKERKSRMANMSLVDRLRRTAKLFIKSQAFFWLVVVFVVLNAVSLGIEYYNQPTWLDQTLHSFAIVFAVVFSVEIAIKMFAMGLETYFRSKQNIFETIIILGSVIELILQSVNPKWSVGIAVFRCFRLLRIFKLTRYWPQLTQFVLSVTSSLKSIASLLVFLLLFLTIFALLGMVLFGGNYNFPEGRPNFNFDTFPTALITCFQITTAKDWPARMFDGVRSQGGITGFGMAYAPYFVVMVLFGSYTLLNLFLAIAVDSIATNDEVELAEDGKLKRRSEDLDDDFASSSSIENSEEPSEDIANDNNAEEANKNQPQNSTGAEKPATTSSRAPTSSEKRNRKYRSELISMPPATAFMLCGQEAFLRRVCFYIVSDPLFDYFVLATICASTVSLAAEDPVDLNAYRNIALAYFDYAFTAIFTIEMILKMIVLGFVGHPGSYIRDAWNVIDLIVVISAYIGFIIENSGLGAGYATAVKSLRIIRVLRPLKTVRRIPKLQAVLTCIIQSLKKVVNVLIMFGLFDYIFSCLAIQLFAGKFFYCNDPTMQTEDECQGTFFKFDDDGIIVGVQDRKWQEYDFNYDHLGIAMLTLFTVTTGDGWPEVMQHSIQATEINRGPKPAYNQSVAGFYIAYLIICPFFLVNVFVAMIVVTFQDQGEDKEIDKNEKRCIDYVINARPINMHMPPPEQQLRRRVWLFVESTPFESFIIAFIFLTTIVMMLKHFDQRAGYDEFENIVNFAGAIIFSVEAVLRIYGYGVLGYFKDIWNAFDFFTVTVSVTDVVISEVNPTLIDIGFLRLFRTVRLIKVMRKIRSIRIILWTFLQSFKALPYVSLLQGMAYFAYAVIGMQLFGTIKSSGDSSINEHTNFQTFFDALLLLFRITTGEGWPDVMLSCTSNKPCSPYAPADLCGTDIGAYVYFVSFILVATFLLLNLFVAVIMDNFEFLTRDSSILGPHHLDEFVRHWAKFDPNGGGKILFTDMYALCREMEPPLGFGQHCPTKTAYRKLIRMNIPLIDNKMVLFTTTLFALVRESLKIRVGDVKQMDKLDKELREVITKFWPKYAKRKMHLLLPPQEATGFQQLTTGKIYAGLMLLDLWKSGLEQEATKPTPSLANLLALASRTALVPILRRRISEADKQQQDDKSQQQKRELRFSDNKKLPGMVAKIMSPEPITKQTLPLPIPERTSPLSSTNLSDVPSTSTSMSPQLPQLPVRLANRGGKPMDLRLKQEDKNSIPMIQLGPRLPYV